MTFAFVFAGQGSQSVGMLAALAAAEPTVRSTFDEASTVLGYDLWQLVSAGPEAALNATERTQPAMLTAGVATREPSDVDLGSRGDLVRCGYSAC